MEDILEDLPQQKTLSQDQLRLTNFNNKRKVHSHEAHIFIKSCVKVEVITESQNNWCWKGCLEVIWSNPLLSQGHLKPAA